jgi:hypothetical protein
MIWESGTQWVSSGACVNSSLSLLKAVMVYGEPDASTVPQVHMTQFYREVEATQA